MFNKVNLVTNADGSDLLKCSLCGYKKKYFGLERPGKCPKCNDGLDVDGQTVYGCWASPVTAHHCRWCKQEMIICPKEGHPNSKFWLLAQGNKQELFVCSNGCHEDGSWIFRLRG